jgi:hypothetical protein
MVSVGAGQRPESGPQRRSGRGGGEESCHPLPGLEPPVIQPVAQRYTTELSRWLESRGHGNLFTVLSPSHIGSRKQGLLYSSGLRYGRVTGSEGTEFVRLSPD